MARVRIMEYGPSIRRAGNPGRITTSDIRSKTRDGVIYRDRVGRPFEVTNKSVLRRKVIKGIEPPGQQPYNYPSPMN